MGRLGVFQEKNTIADFIVEPGPSRSCHSCAYSAQKSWGRFKVLASSCSQKIGATIVAIGVSSGEWTG